MDVGHKPNHVKSLCSYFIIPLFVFIFPFDYVLFYLTKEKKKKKKKKKKKTHSTMKIHNNEPLVIFS
jgi:amino acid permease